MPRRIRASLLRIGTTIGVGLLVVARVSATIPPVPRYVDLAAKRPD